MIARSMHVLPAAGLWSEGRGVIHTPRTGQMFFLPQQPFMPLGTLRQQLLFPSGALDFPWVRLRIRTLPPADVVVAWQGLHPLDALLL